jgi:hypothetical protein
VGAANLAAGTLLRETGYFIWPCLLTQLSIHNDAKFDADSRLMLDASSHQNAVANTAHFAE